MPLADNWQKSLNYLHSLQPTLNRTTSAQTNTIIGTMPIPMDLQGTRLTVAEDQVHQLQATLVLLTNEKENRTRHTFRFCYGRT